MIKDVVRAILPDFLWLRLHRIKAGIHRLAAPSDPSQVEIARLAGLPRYVETTTDLMGFEATIPDGPSFIPVWSALFQNGIYDFSTNGPSPRILDCGANVGLSCLFFKRRFPDSRITAFEPDPTIFAYLKDFVARAKLSGIELVPKGVWSSATNLSFYSEGSDSGRICCIGSQAAKVIEIQTVRLRDYLCEPIDFLKIDIEGAETEVLIDCADSLQYVNRLFVEYHSFIAQPQTLDQILTVLRHAGFRIQIHPGINAEKPFLDVPEHFGMDLQLNIFAYRPQK
jgi:FkbM family methyltransferase